MSININLHKFLATLLDERSDPSKLKKILPVDTHLCESIIKLGSKHLVLPSINYYINKKNINDFFPTEFVNYLSNISEINYKRNQEIYRQISKISELFIKKNINHVFIKGSAMLVFNHHFTLNSRMITDIDILVSEDDLYKSRNILLKNKYVFHKYASKMLMNKIDDHNKKHLDRMNHPDQICSVELHRKITHNKDEPNLNPVDILNRKTKIKNVFIPSTRDNWLIAIYNWQFNDYGFSHNYISFRALVDVINLEPSDLNKKIDSEKNVVKHFYTLISVIIDRYPSYFPILKKLFILQLNFRLVRIVYRILQNFRLLLSLIASRLVLILKNKEYRTRILKNPEIIIRNFLSYIRR